MKKFFTVLLTLVVVFAFTGSAMAMGWNQEVSPAEPKDEFKLSITKLEYNPAAGAVGSSYWKEYTGSVVKNTMVRALVTLEIPAKGELSDVIDTNLDALKLQFKGKNIKITSVDQYIDSKFVKNLGAVTTITGGSAGIIYQYMVVGVVEDDGGAAIEATLSFGVPFRDGKFSYNYAGDNYTVTHSGNTFSVSDNKTGVVIFEVDSTSRIKSVKVDVSGETREYLYKPTGEVALPEAHQKVIQKVYDSLGFTFDGVFGYMYEQGFIATHGHGFTMTQVANYNGSVAVTTPDQIMLPQTGDAPNIVGFAMLGAAVVACAIIIIRKKIYN